MTQPQPLPDKKDRPTHCPNGHRLRWVVDGAIGTTPYGVAVCRGQADHPLNTWLYRKIGQSFKLRSDWSPVGVALARRYRSAR